MPVEDDVEFPFVKAAYLAWQITGDDTWTESLLPKMEKALQYILTHPWRWDKNLGLVKRQGKRILINFHNQRRWLDILALEGALLDLVVILYFGAFRQSFYRILHN